MDQKSIQYSMSVFDEIEAAIEPMGLVLTRVDLEKSQGIPTGVIGFPNGAKGWAISCNVVPTHVNEINTTFVQLYQQLSTPFPEKRSELERFIKGAHEKFLLGCLLLSNDCLCMKYVFALDPAQALGHAHFRTAIFAFCRHSETFALRARAICDGTMTVEQALASSAVQ